MTSIIRLHNFSGLGDESPPSYILQIDEFRFLLDCGWDEKWPETKILKELKRWIPKIDAVLITQPDLGHLGLLPYLVGSCGLSCPIYGTVPIYKMGQMFLYDAYLSRAAVEDFEWFNLDHVDAAFDQLVQLKYNQTLSLQGRGLGISITPLPAGHMLGGTVWRILKNEEDILYASSFNHKKERTLNGAELEKLTAAQRPSLLITESLNVRYTQERRRTRDEQLLTKILQTLRNGGNVLVAVDTAGRVLELAHMLDQLWRNKESGLSAYSLAFLNNVAYNVLEFAKSMIEWMSDKLMRSFDGARSNPFQFRNMSICHSLQELSRLPGPKVVLASSPDLETGFARELFVQWSADPKNTLILTSRPNPGTLGRLLVDDPSSKTIQLEVKRRVKLDGKELEDHYRQIRLKEMEIGNEEKQKRGEDQASSESEDSDSDGEIKITGIFTGPSRTVCHDLFIKPGMETKVQTGIFKTHKCRFPVYPFIDQKIKYDEYGEFIRQEDFLNTDTGSINSSQTNPTSTAGPASITPESSEPPTKILQSQLTLTVNCQILFIDFEGRSDGESITKIIAHMAPRRLILTRGSLECSNEIKKALEQTFPEGKVFIPKGIGEIVDVTTESHIYQLKLKDSLVSQLRFQRSGKDVSEIAWVDGRICIEADDTEGEDQVLVPILESLDPEEIPAHDRVFINELKLSDFKIVLARNGIPSEFSGGVLWCANGTVALRRQDSGKLTVEGCLSDDYYNIRDLLYEQYAIL